MARQVLRDESLGTVGLLRMDGPHEQGDTRAVEFTPSSDGDSPVLPGFLDQMSEVKEFEQWPPMAPVTYIFG